MEDDDRWLRHQTNAVRASLIVPVLWTPLGMGLAAWVVEGIAEGRAETHGLTCAHPEEPYSSAIMIAIVLGPLLLLGLGSRLAAARHFRDWGHPAPLRLAVAHCLPLVGAYALAALPLLGLGLLRGDPIDSRWLPLLLLPPVVLALAGVLGALLRGSCEQPLEDGPLATALQQLAERAGVRLRGVVLLHHDDPGQATFEAGSDRRLTLSEALLAALTEPQAVALAAHELGHLKLRHGWRYILTAALAVPLCFLAPYAAMPLVIAWRSMPDWSAAAVMILPMVLAISLHRLLFRAMQRRCEYAADAFGAKLTGAVPLLEALAISDRLMHLPLDFPVWREWLWTHPSWRRRAAALGLSAEEIDRIATATSLAAGTTPW